MVATRIIKLRPGHVDDPFDVDRYGNYIPLIDPKEEYKKEYKEKKLAKLDILFALGNNVPMDQVWAMFRAARGY